jgi:hypothetical protein
MKKAITSLTEEDLARHPVWDYYEDDKGGIVASPVRRIPVDSLQSRLVGCQVTLSNGQKCWAELSNIELRNAKATSHFLVLSVVRGPKRFHLARYFDVDYLKRGPVALSQFLGLPVQEVFPIAYDIGPYVTGATIPTTGLIREQPDERLSQKDLMKLSLG